MDTDIGKIVNTNEGKIKIVLVCVLFLIIIAGGTLAYMITKEVPDLEDDMKNKNSLRYDTELFQVYIMKYPLKGNVTTIDTKNKTIKVGISADKHELNFGYIPEGRSVKKFLDFQNREDRPAKVCFKVHGNISDLVEIKDNEFILKENEKREILLRFNGKSAGSYTGYIYVIMKKPRYDLLEPLLSVAGC